MRGYTVDEIMATQPCDDYPRERVETLWAGRKALTVVEIAALDIPVAITVPTTMMWRWCGI